jgi:hypothetical protein|tara:strand:- start:3820 stop:4653 length:834 start_codon:yes stop_codon:yes gene_type:complete
MDWLMNSGVLLFAFNNEQVDYVSQARFLAKRIKKYLNLPTTLVTDDVERVVKFYNGKEVFDKIVSSSIEYKNRKTYQDGSLSKKVLEFKNFNRSDSYDLTPYDRTLVLDTDYIVSNDLLAHAMTLPHELMMYKKSMDISGWRDTSEFELISETSIDFWWATCIIFDKSDRNEAFFNLVKHIKEHYEHYRNLYQVTTTVFRNDIAFSIANHIMGYTKELPGKMVYSTGKDILQKIKDDSFTLLVEKQDRIGEYTLIRTQGINLHIMNKFSLGREIANA